MSLGDYTISPPMACACVALQIPTYQLLGNPTLNKKKGMLLFT